MKTVTALLICAALMLSAVSCADKSSSPVVSGDVGTTAPPEESSVTTVATEPPETEPPIVVEIPEEKLNEMSTTLASLEATVPDLYGWIYVDGTDINYPLVKGEDNDYYLNMSPEKRWQEIGSIFVDYRNRWEIEDPYNKNIVIYGHNLTWGGMFHDVQKMYENEELFRNSYVYIYTFDGVFVFEPIAVYEANAYYKYFRTHFDHDWEFVSFANGMAENSIYPEDVVFDEDDRMITLSTCTNTYVDGRYVLQAKLVQVTRWE